MLNVVYEDNHLIVVSKCSGDIVQGDKTGDRPLSEDVKAYIKERYNKPGAVFLGVVHRLDRPVSGLVMFARTSKALSRLGLMFQRGEVHKTYWAVVEGVVPDAAIGQWHELRHFLTRNEQQNKSYAHDREVPHSKEARLRWRLLGCGEHYSLVEVELLTGRHHQIRCQLARAGMPIRGDLKYGARRSNADGSISLLSRRMEFVHPVSGLHLSLEAPLPADALWHLGDAAQKG